MIPLPAAAFDADGKLVDANEAFSETLLEVPDSRSRTKKVATVEASFQDLVRRSTEEEPPLIVRLPTVDGEIGFSAWLKESGDDGLSTLVLVDSERSLSDRRQALIYAAELQELYGAVKEHYPRLKELHQVSETLQQNLESAQVASIGLEQLAQNYGCSGVVGVFWSVGHRFTVFSGSSSGEFAREISLSPTARQVRALRTAIESGESKPRLLPKWIRDGLSASVGGSFTSYRIATGFVTSEGNIGIVSLPGQDMADDNWYLMSFADQLSMALRNAVLYDDLVVHSSNTNALLLSAETLGRSLRISEVLSGLTRLVIEEILDGEGVASVSLGTPEDGAAVSGYARNADGAVIPLRELNQTNGVGSHGLNGTAAHSALGSQQDIASVAERVLGGSAETRATQFDVGGQVGEVVVFTPEGEPLSESKGRLLDAMTEHARVALTRALLFAHQRTGSIEVAQQQERRSQLLLQMAHELKTPLTAIRPLIDILDMSSDKPTTPEQHSEIVSILRRGIDRLEDVGNRYLDGFETPDGPTRKLSLEVVDVTQLASQVARLHTESLQEAGQCVSVTSDGESAVVVADPAAIEEVISNILTNCKKYAGQDANISVTISNRTGEFAIVEVADDGAGMTPDVLKNTRKAMENPNSVLTGSNHLGLQISARLIALHGGESWIRSRRGRGTTVGFSLPSE